MNYPVMKVKTMTINTNGAARISTGAGENKRLRAALQKAVRREKAPESLREKIRLMIRE